MNYVVQVYYTNSTDVKTFNATTLDLAIGIRVREMNGRFVRKVRLLVELDETIVWRDKSQR